MIRDDATHGLASWFGVPERRLVEFMFSRKRLMVAMVGLRAICGGEEQCLKMAV